MPADGSHNILNILEVNYMYKVNNLSFVNKCLLLDVPPFFADEYK